MSFEASDRLGEAVERLEHSLACLREPRRHLEGHLIDCRVQEAGLGQIDRGPHSAFPLIENALPEEAVLGENSFELKAPPKVVERVISRRIVGCLGLAGVKALHQGGDSRQHRGNVIDEGRLRELTRDGEGTGARYPISKNRLIVGSQKIRHPRGGTFRRNRMVGHQDPLSETDLGTRFPPWSGLFDTTHDLLQGNNHNQLGDESGHSTLPTHTSRATRTREGDVKRIVALRHVPHECLRPAQQRSLFTPVQPGSIKRVRRRFGRGACQSRDGGREA
jgi:hypothetical protein